MVFTSICGTVMDIILMRDKWTAKMICFNGPGTRVGVSRLNIDGACIPTLRL